MSKRKNFVTHSEEDLSSSWADQSERAQAVLDHVIYEDTPEVKEAKEGLVAVEEAIAEEALLERESTRSRLRVVFVSADASVLEKGSSAERHYLALAEVFDEIHVVVLANTQADVERVATNVWVYRIDAQSGAGFARRVRAFARDNLCFNEAVRPDLVVAEDAMVAAGVGVELARFMVRHLVVAVDRDYFTKTESGQSPVSFWEKRRLHRVLKAADLITAKTGRLVDLVSKRYPNSTVESLPHFYDFDSYRKGVPLFDVHDRYSEYKFIMVVVASLEADGPLHDVFAAVRSTLLHNKIGVVVIGSGPAKELFKEKIELLGISDKVVFVSPNEDATPYFKTADLLVEAGTGSASEDTVLRAIVSQLPLVAYKTDLRSDVLEDGESAYLCDPTDSHCLTQKINLFLNNQGIRTQFKRRLGQIRDDRLHEDKGAYYRAYKRVLESVLREEAAEPAVDETNSEEKELEKGAS